MRVTILLNVLMLALLGGCSEPVPQPSAGSLTDAWLGRWIGPEGTFLLLEGGNGNYQVTVQNLDGPRVFQGVAVDDRVQFERDGVTETLTATNGTDTGMKWLADKKDCLTIRSGEGFCRD